MPKVKLLFVMASMGRGGAERSLVNLLELIDKEKFDVDLLVFDQRGALMEQIPGWINIIEPDKETKFLSYNDKKVLIKNVSFKGVLARINYMLKKKKGSNYLNAQNKWSSAFLPAVKQMTKEYDTAVAFMHSLPSYFVIDKANAKKKILWVHNDYSRLAEGKEFDRKYFEAADAVVTISEQCVSELENAFPEFDGKFKCIYNLNPESKIREKADEYYPEEYIGFEGAKIISIGRLNNQKGFDYAIDSAAIMKKKGIDFHWFIIGEGELKEKLETQIEKNDVKDCVFLLGARENPYPYIKNADIVAQTSRYEGKSIVLDEAKILYKPILTTDYVSVHDQIENGQTGVIVPIDIDEIATGIINLINDKENQKRLSTVLRSQEDITEKELEKYQSLFSI